MSKHVVILGGGFAGVYTAMYLEKLVKGSDVEISLINRENYFVFQPMLPEVISGSIEIQHIINPIRRLCKRTNLVVRDVESIDLENRVVLLQRRRIGLMMCWISILPEITSGSMG